MIVFGFEPYPIEVVVAANSVFTAEIQTVEPWPASTRIALRFLPACEHDPPSPIQWDAAASEHGATWDVPAAEVTDLVRSQSRVAHLLFNDTLWGKGRVRVLT